MGQLRIIAGELGGRRLAAPPGSGTRPTSERVREAIASALAARGAIADARVLELYAGSGALGFEMLSRGAAHVLFVERDPKVARLLRENVSSLGVSARCAVLGEDVGRNKAHEAVLAAGPYSLVLADPPYRDAQAAADTLLTLCGRGLLASGGSLLLEHAVKGPPRFGAPFEVISTYRYGDTAVTLFAYEDEQP